MCVIKLCVERSKTGAVVWLSLRLARRPGHQGLDFGQRGDRVGNQALEIRGCQHPVIITVRLHTQKAREPHHDVDLFCQRTIGSLAGREAAALFPQRWPVVEV
jgi:hypothetical protein